jgi:hypothetical protein
MLSRKRSPSTTGCRALACSPMMGANRRLGLYSHSSRPHLSAMLLRPEYLFQNLDRATKDGGTLRTIGEACDYTMPLEGIVTLIGNLQTEGPWPKRFTLRLSLGATLA